MSCSFSHWLATTPLVQVKAGALFIGYRYIEKANNPFTKEGMWNPSKKEVVVWFNIYIPVCICPRCKQSIRGAT